MLGRKFSKQPIKVSGSYDRVHTFVDHLNPSEMKSRGIAPVLDVSFPSGFVVSSYAVVYNRTSRTRIVTLMI
jgi:hypothetical protein